MGILILVCTYSGWIEAFPPHAEKVGEIIKALMREVIARYGLPLSIWLDNGPAFVLEIVQTLTQILKIKSKLHAAYRSQSSGKAYKSDPQNHFSQALPGNSVPLNRNVTIVCTQCVLYTQDPLVTHPLRFSMADLLLGRLETWKCLDISKPLEKPYTTSSKKFWKGPSSPWVTGLIPTNQET